MSELREEIRKIILFNSDLTPPGEVADKILASPAGMIAKRECPGEPVAGKHLLSCICNGSGFLTRKLSLAEVVEYAKAQVRMHTTIFMRPVLPSGERIEAEGE